MDMDALKIELAKTAKDQAVVLAAEYGPTILKMTQDDLKAWLDLFFLGRYADAYAIYLRARATGDLLADWDKEIALWHADNAANAARLEIRNAIGQKFCDAMLCVILAAVTL